MGGLFRPAAGLGGTGTSGMQVPSAKHVPCMISAVRVEK